MRSCYGTRANLEQKALNLFNAALVTPTYYVFFTSSTIVTSAILFQGFKGTPATISTVIMGFLQICSGVVLLQLSKSAKDVPDSAVFKGDLDQVRTVAEQEEPEYEPRADTLRGGASIIRSLSKARTEKEALEAKRIHEEQQMQSIGEDEPFEWDGLRRRKTVLDPDGRPSTQRSGTIVRQKTIHPPLGMSHFPTDDSDDDTEYHPGFFQRLRSRGKSRDGRPGSAAPVVMETLPPQADGSGGDPAAYAKSPYLQDDTAYNPHGSQHIHFGALPSPPPHADHERSSSRDTLQPPRPPPHTARRQFSFTNVFGRNRAGSASAGQTASSGAGTGLRPSSKHSRKSSREGKGATEEERLGLVKGDSGLGPIESRDSREEDEEGRVVYRDDGDWGILSERGGSSPERSRGETGGGHQRSGSREGEWVGKDWSSEDEEREMEKVRKVSSGAFL